MLGARRVIAYLMVIIAGTLLVGMFVVILLQVITRAILNVPIIWTEEAARYVHVWLVMLGCVWVAYTGDHVGLGLGRKPTGGRLDALTTWAGRLISIAVLIVVAYAAITTVTSFNGTSAALEIPMFWVYLAFPVGTTLWMLLDLTGVLQDMMLKKSTARREQTKIGGSGA